MFKIFSRRFATTFFAYAVTPCLAGNALAQPYSVRSGSGLTTGIEGTRIGDELFSCLEKNSRGEESLNSFKLGPRGDLINSRGELQRIVAVDASGSGELTFRFGQSAPERQLTLTPVAPETYEATFLRDELHPLDAGVRTKCFAPVKIDARRLQGLVTVVRARDVGSTSIPLALCNNRRALGADVLELWLVKSGETVSIRGTAHHWQKGGWGNVQPKNTSYLIEGAGVADVSASSDGTRYTIQQAGLQIRRVDGTGWEGAVEEASFPYVFVKNSRFLRDTDPEVQGELTITFSDASELRDVQTPPVAFSGCQFKVEVSDLAP